jgi:hypothetical protein
MCVSNLENTMYHYPLPPGCEPIQCNTIFSFFSFCSRHAHYSSCLTLINNHSSFSFTCKVSDITRLFYSVVFFYMLCCHEIEYISSACNAIVWWPIIHSLVVGTLPATMRYLFQVGSTTRWVHAFVKWVLLMHVFETYRAYCSYRILNYWLLQSFGFQINNYAYGHYLYLHSSTE